MKKDLSTAFDSAGESDENVPPTVNMCRHRTKAKANYKTRSISAASKVEDDTLEEIVMQHPLKKKRRRKFMLVKRKLLHVPMLDATVIATSHTDVKYHL